MSTQTQLLCQNFCELLQSSTAQILVLASFVCNVSTCTGWELKCSVSDSLCVFLQGQRDMDLIAGSCTVVYDPKLIELTL